MRHSLLALSLLWLPLPVLAQSAPVPAAASPAPAVPTTGVPTTGVPTTGVPTTGVPTTGVPTTILDKLVGKPQIVGITARNGTRVLGHIFSGVQGQYLVQTFHFAGPPQHGTATVGTGRQRRTVQTTQQTALPDDEAVRLLMLGVAGSNLKPRELPAGQATIAAQDIKFLQALSPPSKKAAADKTKPALWTMTTLWPIPTAGSQAK